MAQTWQPLPHMAHARADQGVVVVPGGMLAVGGSREPVPDELFDEASGRWFELPHLMAEPRRALQLVSLRPAAALAPPPAAAGAAAAATAAAAAAVAAAAAAGAAAAAAP